MPNVISKDGTSIVFDRVGHGPPLMLVLGAFNDRSAGVGLAECLAPHFTVINYDRRGRGASGDNLPYAVDREIDDLAALIADVGGAAAVFGYSSGAGLSLRAAAAGLPITKLTLYDAPYMVGDSQPGQRVDHAAHLSKLIAAGRRRRVLSDEGGRHSRRRRDPDAPCAISTSPRGDGAHPGVRNDHPGRRFAAHRACTASGNADACGGRRYQPVHAPGGGSPRRGLAEWPGAHPRRPDARY